MTPGALLAGLEKDEQLLNVLPAGDWSGEVLLATAGGLIKRTAFADLNVRKSKYTAIGLKGSDRLICAMDPADKKDLLLVSRLGMAIHFALEEVSLVGRTAAGVKSMNLANEDQVAFAFAHNCEGEVVLISDMGYMKRCLFIDFDRQARGGKGVRCFNLLKNGSNGSRVAGALMVTQPYDFQIVQKSGTLTAMNTEDVPIETRNSKGQPYVMVVMGDLVTGLTR